MELLPGILWIALLVEPPVGDNCPGRVTKLYEQGHHVDAARTAEKCWTDSRDPILLYYAGQARLRAGHRTQAALHLRAHLERIAADAPQRTRVERLLAEVVQGLVQVALDAPAGEVLLLHDGQTEQVSILWPGGPGRLDVEPGSWGVWLASDGFHERVSVHAEEGAQWHVAAKPKVAPRVETFNVDITTRPRRRISLEWWPVLAGVPRQKIELGRGGTRLQLASGAWHMTLRAPGREAVEREVEVTGPRQLAFELQRDRVGRARLGLGVGLGLASLGLWATGAVLVAQGRQGYAGRPTGGDAMQPLGDPASLEPALADYDRMMAGAGVLGAAAGVLGVALTDAVMPRRRMPAVELGLGGGLLLGGAIALGSLHRTHRPWDGGFPGGAMAGDTFATALLGAGTGLVSAGLVSLLARRVGKQQALRRERAPVARGYRPTPTAKPLATSR